MRMWWKFASERSYDVETDPEFGSIMLSCYEPPEAAQRLALMVECDDYEEAMALGETWVIQGKAEVLRIVLQTGRVGMETDPLWSPCG